MVLMGIPSASVYLTLQPLPFRVLPFPILSVRLPMSPAPPEEDLVIAVLGVFLLTLRDVQHRLSFQLEPNISIIDWGDR